MIGCGKEGIGIKRALVVMSTECCMEKVNHYIVHLKLSYVVC